MQALPQEEQELLKTLNDLETWKVLLAPAAMVLLLMALIGPLYGSVRSNGVRIGPRQFPEVWALWQTMSSELGLADTPELFMLNGNGSLNAFVTCIPGFRPFGVIYSDILERALALQDIRTLRFILGHELGHIKLGHVRWWYHLGTFLVRIPPLSYLIGLPLSRACEYGSDRVGQHLSGDQEGRALMMLAAGKHLYTHVDAQTHLEEQIAERSVWDALHNVTADHPNLNWRIGALRCQCHGPLLWAKPWPASVQREAPATTPIPD